MPSLKTKESRLLDTFLAEQVSKEIYDNKVLEIHNERVSLNQQIVETKRKGMRASATLEPTKEVFLQASRAKKEFLDADEYKKRNIIEKLLWNLTFKNGEVAQRQFKSPYEILFKAPKNGDILTLRRVRDLNP